MIKKIFLLISFSFTITALSQEEDPKSKILSKIALQSCDCISQKKIDFAKENIDVIKTTFGVCVIESYTNNKVEADKYLEVSFTDSNLMRKLGEQVAIKMLTHCPDFVMALANDKNDATETTDISVDDSESFLTIEGYVTNIQESLFNTVEVKDIDNRLQKLLWLEYFEGDNLLYDLNKLKKNKVKITCYEYEMFDPKIKDYRNFKIIKKMTIL